jgi:hypothetical protein
MDAADTLKAAARTVAARIMAVAAPTAADRTAVGLAVVSMAAERVSAGPADLALVVSVLAAATTAGIVILAGTPLRLAERAIARIAALVDLPLVLTATPATPEAAVLRLAASRVRRAPGARRGTAETPLHREWRARPVGTSARIGLLPPRRLLGVGPIQGAPSREAHRELDPPSAPIGLRSHRVPEVGLARAAASREICRGRVTLRLPALLAFPTLRARIVRRGPRRVSEAGRAKTARPRPTRRDRLTPSTRTVATRTVTTQTPDGRTSEGLIPETLDLAIPGPAVPRFRLRGSDLAGGGLRVRDLAAGMDLSRGAARLAGEAGLAETTLRFLGTCSAWR